MYYTLCNLSLLACDSCRWSLLCRIMGGRVPNQRPSFWPSRYRLVWLVLALGSGGVLLALAHLLLFHVVIICKGVSTYDYILAARARKEAKLQKTHSHVGPLWAWIVPTPRKAKVVPLNIVSTSPHLAEQALAPQEVALEMPGLQCSTPRCQECHGGPHYNV